VLLKVISFLTSAVFGPHELSVDLFLCLQSDDRGGHGATRPGNGLIPPGPFRSRLGYARQVLGSDSVEEYLSGLLSKTAVALT
jgi:hypothetical protein